VLYRTDINHTNHFIPSAAASSENQRKLNHENKMTGLNAVPVLSSQQ